MNETPEPRAAASLKWLAVGLWLLASLMMVLTVQYAADLTMIIYAAFWASGATHGTEYNIAIFLRQGVVGMMALIAVIVIIGSAEYTVRNFNTPQAWRLLAHILGTATGILLLVMMF